MRYLGLDVGEKTIGLAVGEAALGVATPLRTLARQGGDKDLRAIEAVVAETEATALVVGLPIALDGSEGASARRVRLFGERLRAQLGLPIHYWDERFTTAQAQRDLIEADLRRARRKQVVDQAAATLILQSFIDHAAAEADR